MTTVELADPYLTERKSIDMILSADVFEEILLDVSFEQECALHFRYSIFGWLSPRHSASTKTSI